MRDPTTSHLPTLMMGTTPSTRAVPSFSSSLLPASSSSTQPPTILPPLILGLSGPSASGKTTIATALLALFSPHATLVHSDDFYLPESSLPFRAGHRDWDCAASLDLTALIACLESWKETGKIPGDRKSQGVLPLDKSKEDEFKVALAVERLKGEGKSQWLRQRKLLIVEGFLLFPTPPLPPALPPLFDAKILLRVDRDVAKDRREARVGYVTLDGFWTDPPRYFDDVVWPNYVESHERYFVRGNVEGNVDEEKSKEAGVHIGPREGGVVEVLEWVVSMIKREVEGGR